MKNLFKKTVAFMMAAMIMLALAAPVMAATDDTQTETQTETTLEAADSESTAQNVIGAKGMAAGICVGLAAAGGAVGMGLATAKSTESIARQPETVGDIRTTMMLGLVFIETAIIYALVVAILVIFVL